MTDTAGGEQAGARLGRPLLVLGAVIAVGTFAAALDATIVSLALNSIRTELGAPLHTIQWIITGYLLGIATAIPVTGWDWPGCFPAGQADVRRARGFEPTLAAVE